MYRAVVTICTTSLTFSTSTFCPHSVFMCFVWISEQTAIISLYNINWLVFMTEVQCVYCAVRTGPLVHLRMFSFLQFNPADTQLHLVPFPTIFRCWRPKILSQFLSPVSSLSNSQVAALPLTYNSWSSHKALLPIQHDSQVLIFLTDRTSI